MKCNSKNGLSAVAETEKDAIDMIGSTNFNNVYHIECLDAEGNLKWEDVVYNTVVNEGLNDVLTVYFKAGTGAAHYVGLITGPGATVLAAETLASKAWTENVAYTAPRPTLTLGSVASQSVDNSASKASFAITGTATIGGIFIAESATQSETASTLYGGGAFTGGDKSVANTDTLNVTVTLTTSSA